MRSAGSLLSTVSANAEADTATIPPANRAADSPTNPAADPSVNPTADLPADPPANPSVNSTAERAAVISEILLWR